MSAKISSIRSWSRAVASGVSCAGIFLSVNHSASAQMAWIPENAKVLKGIRIAYSDPCKASDWGGHWMEAARVWEFGLVCLDRGKVPTNRSGVQAALDGLAGSLGHPEIATVPFIVSGFSWSSGATMSVAAALPERCIAAVSSGINFGVPAALLKVPVAVIANEGDNFHEHIGNIQGGRSQGAPWCLVPRWNGFHNWYNSSNFTLIYYDHVIRRRLGESGKLRELSGEEGWVGLYDKAFRSDSPRAFPFSNHAGGPDNTFWFPNEYLARLWQGFGTLHDGLFDASTWTHTPYNSFGAYFAAAQPGTLKLISPPSNSNTPSVYMQGASITIAAQYTGARELERLDLLDGDIILKSFPGNVPVASHATTTLAPGYHALMASAYFKDGGSSVSPMAAILVKPAGGARLELIPPASPSGMRPGSSVTLEAKAIHAGDSLVGVEFFAGGTTLGRDDQAPYSMSWQPSQAGEYVIEARAVGGKGEFARAWPLKIVVENPPSLAGLSIHPREAWVKPGQKFSFSAVARDQYGRVMAAPGNITWWISGGGGVGADGLFTAEDETGGGYALTASLESLQAEATVYVSNRIRVNFQLDFSGTPSGFVKDAGAVYGAREGGLQYGWDKAPRHIMQRHTHPALSAAYTTFIPMHSQTSPPYTKTYNNYKWEIALPAGDYTVRAVAGDALNKDIAVWQSLPRYEPEKHVFKILAEDVLIVDGQPTHENPWVEGTKNVTVADGKLTLSNAPGQNWNKIAFLEIIPQGDKAVVSLGKAFSGAVGPGRLRVLPGRIVYTPARPGFGILELRTVAGRTIRRAEAQAGEDAVLAVEGLRPGLYVLEARFGAAHARHRVMLP